MSDLSHLKFSSKFNGKYRSSYHMFSLHDSLSNIYFAVIYMRAFVSFGPLVYRLSIMNRKKRNKLKLKCFCFSIQIRRYKLVTKVLHANFRKLF